MNDNMSPCVVFVGIGASISFAFLLIVIAFLTFGRGVDSSILPGQLADILISIAWAMAAWGL